MVIDGDHALPAAEQRRGEVNRGFPAVGSDLDDRAKAGIFAGDLVQHPALYRRHEALCRLRRPR